MTLTIFHLLTLPLAVLSQQTQRLFVDSEADQEWAASVVDQNACGTTVDLVCTAGSVALPGGYGTLSCDPSGFESGFASASATYSGTSIYQVSQSYDLLRNGGLKIQVTETCSLYGRSSAICTADISASTRGVETSLDLLTTYEGAEASRKFMQVPITEGTITTANATCSSTRPFSTPAASSTSGSNVVGGSGDGEQQEVETASEAGARLVEIRKIVVIPGAAALLAAAGFL